MIEVGGLVRVKMRMFHTVPNNYRRRTLVVREVVGPMSLVSYTINTQWVLKPLAMSCIADAENHNLHDIFIQIPTHFLEPVGEKLQEIV